MSFLKCALLALLLIGLPAGVWASEDGARGSVTNLPLPRFVSMKADKANVRRGPGLTQKVDWVFTRKNMPLQVVAEYGNWRRVHDVDGAGGWIHFSLLSGVRTVIVQKDYTPLRSSAVVGADPNAYAEQGVVAFLVKCHPNWCQIKAGGQRGWVLKSEIWGEVPDKVGKN
ncbi:MAG: aspartyl-trna synthetase [Alphaproteobacteria bacterium]|nr:aspartyl-trna synthetase [Alphaproteobacteria bacterium]